MGRRDRKRKKRRLTANESHHTAGVAPSVDLDISPPMAEEIIVSRNEYTEAIASPGVRTIGKEAGDMWGDAFVPHGREKKPLPEPNSEVSDGAGQLWRVTASDESGGVTVMRRRSAIGGDLTEDHRDTQHFTAQQWREMFP